MNWSFSELWNNSLIVREEREYKPRNYLWASELGRSPINVYHALKGTIPTNPPNSRSLRKFQAGNMIEWLVKFVLQRTGLEIRSQQRLQHQYPGLLMVSGKQDFIVGGRINVDKAIEDISRYELPEMIHNASIAIAKSLKEQYGDQELGTMALEIKSAADNMFGVYQRSGANPHHILQCFHYIKTEDLPVGKVVYINKDNMMIHECPVFNPSNTEEKYKGYIEMITDMVNSGEVPKKEPEIMFNTTRMTFSMNFEVEYSNYLTMLYGYPTPEDFRLRWAQKVKDFNRVYKRCVNGDKITEKNLDIINEAKKYFDWDYVVDLGKNNKALVSAEEEE